MSDILTALAAERKSIPTLGRINDRGSSDVQLEDKTFKSPDCSHYDPNMKPGERLNMSTYKDPVPTIVWEVGYSEQTRKLAIDCARSVGASGGLTNMAIALNIVGGLVPGGRRLTAMSISPWTVMKYTPNDQDVTPEQCGVLRRTDKHGPSDAAGTSVSDEYSFSLLWNGKVNTWKVGTVVTQVSRFKVLVD